jgi:hypothetical protein
MPIAHLYAIPLAGVVQKSRSNSFSYWSDKACIPEIMAAGENPLFAACFRGSTAWVANQNREPGGPRSASREAQEQLDTWRLRPQYRSLESASECRLMPGKRVQIDDETWAVLDLLARDRMMTFQEVADEALADFLKKHGRPVGLKAALRKSAGSSAEVIRLKKPRKKK